MLATRNLFPMKTTPLNQFVTTLLYNSNLELASLVLGMNWDSVFRSNMAGIYTIWILNFNGLITQIFDSQISEDKGSSYLLRRNKFIFRSLRGQSEEIYKSLL